MYVLLIGLLVAQAVLVSKLFGWKVVGKILGVAAVVIGFEFLVLYGEPWLVFGYVLGIFFYKFWRTGDLFYGIINVLNKYK